MQLILEHALDLINKTKSLLPKNRFVRNVSVLTIGSIGSQAIIVAASPVLTRLFTSTDFGILSVYGAALALIGVVSTLRYHLAIPLAKENEDAYGLVALSLMSTFLIALITFFGVWFYRYDTAKFFSNEAIADYFWILPCGVLALGFYQTLEYWFIRSQNFTKISTSKVARSVGIVVVQISMCFLGPIALLLGRSFGDAAASTLLATGFYKKPTLKQLAHSPIKTVAIEYRAFPFFSIWNGLVSTSARLLPSLIIAGTLGLASAGIFALTTRVLTLPLTMVGKSVGDVFYKKISSVTKDGELGELVTRINKSLATISFPAAAIFYVYAPNIFTVVFGEEWGAAGELAQIMTPFFFFKFVVTPVTWIYPVLNRQGLALFFQASLFCLGIGAVVLGTTLFKDLQTAVILMVFVNSVIYVLQTCTTYYCCGLHPIKAIVDLGVALPSTIVVALPCIATSYFLQPEDMWSGLGILGLCLSCVLLVFHYVLYFKRCNK